MRKIFVKKYGIGILLLILTVLCIGCGNTSKESEQTKKEQQEINKNDEILKEDSSTQHEVSVEMVKKASTTEDSAFEYEKVDGGISISSYVGTDEIVVIPEQIEGSNVVAIGEYAFANNTTIKGVMIPDKLLIIGIDAFCNCSSLQVVVCGEQLQVIDEYAFNYCEALYCIELNDTIEELRFGSFGYAKSLKEIHIPNSVTNIDSAFSGLGDTLTIIAEAGSVAEQYATEEKIPFKTK